MDCAAKIGRSKRGGSGKAAVREPGVCAKASPGKGNGQLPHRFFEGSQIGKGRIPKKGGAGEGSLVEIGRPVKLGALKGGFAAKVGLLKKGRGRKLGGRKIYIGQPSPFEIGRAPDAAVAASKPFFEAGFEQGDPLLEVGAHKVQRLAKNGAF